MSKHFFSCAVRSPERCWASAVTDGELPAGWRAEEVPGFGLLSFCPEHGSAADAARAAAAKYEREREARLAWLDGAARVAAYLEGRA